MSSPTPRSAALGLPVWILGLALVLAAPSAGCGKYGKPVRRPPNPPDEQTTRAADGETRYTLSTSSSKSTSTSGAKREREAGEPGR